MSASVRLVKRAIGASATRATSAPRIAASAIPATPTITSSKQDPAQLVVQFAQRPGDQHRAARAGADRQHPQPDVPFTVLIAQRAAPAAGGDRLVARAHRDPAAMSPAQPGTSTVP